MQAVQPAGTPLTERPGLSSALLDPFQTGLQRLAEPLDVGRLQHADMVSGNADDLERAFDDVTPA